MMASGEPVCMSMVIALVFCGSKQFFFVYQISMIWDIDSLAYNRFLAFYIRNDFPVSPDEY